MNQVHRQQHFGLVRTVSLYFGNPDDEDSVVLAEQLLIGTSLFSGLYNKEELASATTSPSMDAADVSTSPLLVAMSLAIVPVRHWY